MFQRERRLMERRPCRIDVVDENNFLTSDFGLYSERVLTVPPFSFPKFALTQNLRFLK